MIGTAKKSARRARKTLTAGEISELRDELLRELARREGGQRAQVVDALKRMEAGTYGACATCGDLISNERLLIVPETSTCIACARHSRNPSTGVRR